MPTLRSARMYTCRTMADHWRYYVERRTWVEDGYQLSFGKPFVHIEHEGRVQSTSWFTIEYNIPSVQLLAGHKSVSRRYRG